MDITLAPDQVWIHTEVFPHWAVSIPRELRVIEPDDDQYWHARDEHRSVSLTSMEVTEAGARVSARRLLDQVGSLLLPKGRRITEAPPGLAARAVYARVPAPGVASRALQGVVVADGFILIATITADDEAWCRAVWRTIRHLA